MTVNNSYYYNKKNYLDVKDKSYEFEQTILILYYYKNYIIILFSIFNIICFHIILCRVEVNNGRN